MAATNTNPSRDSIQDFVKDARSKKQNKRNHVRKKVEEAYPELVGKKIRRGAHVYDAIDYILDDLDSYG